MKFEPVYLLPLIGALAIALMAYALVDSSYLTQAQEKSCNKLGMEYYTSQDAIFCIDNKGNAHYVIIDCEDTGFWEYDCSPRIITIGDIRIRPT